METRTATITHPVTFTTVFNPSAGFADVRVQIRALDLEPVKFKLIKESGWTLEKADRVETLYKGYLTLIALYPDEVHVPTHEIDDMWHAHILDTYKYMDDCKRIFGYYLHHFPYLGLRGEHDAAQAEAQFALTRQRFVELTGIDIVDATGCGGGGCGGGSSCGGGGSSCSGGGSSCSSGGDSGGGGGGHDSPSSCSTIIPAIVPATCTTSDPGRSTPQRERSRDPKKPANDPVKKPSVWRRIIPGLHMSEWEASVNTAPLIRTQQRPGRAELMLLAEEKTADTVLH